MLKNIIAITMVLSMSSCLSSLHQLVTSDKVVTDNRMAGEWQENNNTSYIIEELLTSEFFKSTYRATVNGVEKNLGFDSIEDSLLYSKSYVIGFTRSGYRYTMIACLMNLDNELYADMIPVSAIGTGSGNKDNVFDGADYLPSHTLAKIRFSEGAMEIKFLDGDFIKSQLKKGAIAVRYENDNLFNTALITASSAGMQRFIIKYGRDERLYSRANTITLKKMR